MTSKRLMRCSSCRSRGSVTGRVTKYEKNRQCGLNSLNDGRSCIYHVDAELLLEATACLVILGLV